MNTFNGYINEFVDWVTGRDTSDDESVVVSRASTTDGLPASGGSIRELLLSRLKKPFVYYEDEKAGLYRLFSSEDVKNKWIRMNTEGSTDYDPEASTKLELFNFVRPSDTVMTYNGLDPNPKYIINGDSTSSAAQLSFNVYLSKEVAGAPVYESDSFTVTYRVVDSNNVEHISVEEKDSTFLNSVKKVEKNIYSMLLVGQNTVTVTMKARNSSALNSVTFPVYLIEFELSSAFDYSSHFDPNRPIIVPVSVKRSDTALTLKVDIYVDGTLAKLSSDGRTSATWIVNSTETNPARQISIANTYTSNSTSSDHIKHVMKIEAQMYDQDAGVVYYSNVLFFDFIIASSTVGIVNKFVNSGYSVAYNKVSTDPNSGRVILQAVQYEPFTLNWAYYTDRETTLQSINVQWALRTGEEGHYQYTNILNMEAHNRQIAQTLRFIPDTYTTETTYLVALHDGTEIDIFPINVLESTLSISETGGYTLKLSAYGKTNQSIDRNSWTDVYNNVTTTLTGISYDTNSGWSDNSFVTSGVGSYAVVNYCPISNTYDLAGKGKTIEIDFKPEKIVNDGDTLITIGDPIGGHIDIKTNEAALYNGLNKVIHTNYKANERIKLAFIFNPVAPGNVDSNLIFIVNNGILERASSYGTAAAYKSDDGNIKIGNSASGIRVYSIRAYDKALSYDEALNNYTYDCENKAEVVNRNDIFTSSVIDYIKVKNKIDTILITGDMTRLLSQGSLKDESESTVDIKRLCITDASKDFEVKNAMIRKHGQSTLSYPITSLKFWLNKSSNGSATTISLSLSQQAEGLNKNRYMMKNGAIPSNKFVLQANYADSSGTHNGSLLRLINDTWYNAAIDGKHILRTAPQLFTTGEILVHNDEDLNEDGTWVEGTGVGIATGKTWTDIATRPFPYKIRTAADSFPCAVFYQNGPTDGYHFLGQYVFMDDKKSDYLYGERSIYYFGNGNDPFVLKTENTKNGANGKQDTAANRVWNNDNVLRIEVVLPNEIFTSYMNFNITDTSGTHAADDIKYENGQPSKYYWEDYFEIIYPDEDDIAEDDAAKGLTKFDSNSKFVQKVTPFINFLKWITDCKLNYANNTDWWTAGTYANTQEAFEATAHDHLDMYKLAAYYIFFLRFGLVDSVERNAQLKTYDGQHWHYEPWDMDIALGNTNQGQLILNPPLDRNTFEQAGSTTYAFSGRSTSTSNVLWDCLEAWTHWSDVVVPKVAQALYEAGLNYDNIMQMFDEQYAEAWSETMYNESGHFKYVENGGSEWFAWLQGARTSHRHWWVSTSMNYYDAKWSCGSFNEHRVRLFADKAINPIGTDFVTIKPTSSTFFKIAQQEGSKSLGTIQADRTNPAIFDISTSSFSAKDPSYIYGGTFIEEIDLSCFSEKLKAADFTLCYDNVLGAQIKKINVGVPYTITSSTEYSGKVSATLMRLSAYDATKGTDAFESLQVIDITGQSSITSTQDLLSTRNRKNVTDIYAIGSGITEFVSSTSGNRFNTIKLPAVTTTTYNNADPTYTVFNTFVMLNSSWNTIEFWNTSKSGEVVCVLDQNNEPVLDEDNNPVIAASSATFTKTTVPHQITTVQFKGSTASNECAGKFLLDWIDSIEANIAANNPSYTEQDVYDALSTRVFEAENINWGVSGQNISITYNDLARIAKFNRGNNSGGLIKGYIMLSDSQPLTNAQVNNIIQWFGPSVFTKSARNSNLVVDQSSTYTSIVTSGTTVVGQDICLTEGNTASLTATKFMLSEDDNTQYTWSVAVGQNVQSSGVTNVNSVTLTTGDDGVTYITAAQNGTYGDYYITVTAATGGVPTLLTIKVIGSILPDHMTVNTSSVSVSDARPFSIGPALGSAMPMFSLAIYEDGSSTSIRDSYVLFLNGQEVEFYAQPVDGVNPSNVSPSTIRYLISSIMPLYTDYTALTGYENTLQNRTGDGTLYYTKSATHNGVVIGVTSAPAQPALYELRVSMVVGGALYSKTINIIVMNDAQVMHTQLTSSAVQNVLNTLHTSLYGNSLTEYYKSDLLSLVGALDFSTESQSIGTISANDGNSLFNYLPNITSIDLHGCSGLQASSLGILSNGVLQFPASTSLQTLDLSSSSIGSIVVDLSGCPNITTLSTTNTNAGVKFGSGSAISSLSLGSPIAVDITNPKVLTAVTIQSSSLLNDINLVNVNMGDSTTPATMKGFSIFNTLYT